MFCFGVWDHAEMSWPCVHCSHWGYFELRLCPLSDATSSAEKRELHESCFAANKLKQTDGSGTRHWINHGLRSARFMEHAFFRLPAGVTCKRCVLQVSMRAAHCSCDVHSDGHPVSVDCVLCRGTHLWRAVTGRPPIMNRGTACGLVPPSSCARWAAQLHKIA